MFKKTIALTVGATLSVLTASMAFAQDTVNFADYAQSAATLSTLASAVSLVSPCSAPIVFDEHKEEGERVLGVHCQGSEDDEFSVFIRFMDDGNTLIPLKFDYAG